MPIRRGISWPGPMPLSEKTFCMWLRLRVNSIQIIEKTIQNRLNAEMAIYQCVSLESVLTDNFLALLRAIIIQRNLLSFRQSGLRVWSLDELPGDRLTPETLGEIKADSYNGGDGHDTC